MELSERNIKLGVGIIAAAASRHYFKQRKLWPWRVRSRALTLQPAHHLHTGVDRCTEPMAPSPSIVDTPCRSHPCRMRLLAPLPSPRCNLHHTSDPAPTGSHHPSQISTLVAWPALGLAVMDTVIGWAEPKEPVLRKVGQGRITKEPTTRALTSSHVCLPTHRCVHGATGAVTHAARPVP